MASPNAVRLVSRPHSYEPIQGARVLPIFAQLGSHVELLDRIGGIREKCLEIINPERRNPDTGLFEILTALKKPSKSRQSRLLVIFPSLRRIFSQLPSS